MKPVAKVRGGALAVLVVVGVVAACGSGGPKSTDGVSVPATSSASLASPSPTPAVPSSVSPWVSPSAGLPTPSAGLPTPSAGLLAPASFQPSSVTFVSPTKGYVLGVALCQRATCAALVTTDDAGRSWSYVATLPRVSIGDVGVSELRFADAQDGWAFGPQLWSTHDGGRTWSSVEVSGPVSDVEAAAGTAYAVVGGRLLHTAVTSDSWSAVSGVPNVGDGATISLHGHAAWIFSASSHKLFASANGSSWQAFADPCAQFSGYAGVSVAPVSTSAIFLLCGGDAGAGSESKKVLYSTDGGAHATATSVDPPRGGLANGFAAASQNVVAVAARSGASEVYVSHDAGRTWQTPLRQGDGGVGYYDVGFTTATQGVAVYGQGGAGSRLLMTRDAGETWAPVSF